MSTNKTTFNSILDEYTKSMPTDITNAKQAQKAYRLYVNTKNKFDKMFDRKPYPTQRQVSKFHDVLNSKNEGLHKYLVKQYKLDKNKDAENYAWYVLRHSNDSDDGKLYYLQDEFAKWGMREKAQEKDTKRQLAHYCTKCGQKLPTQSQLSRMAR